MGAVTVRPARVDARRSFQTIDGWGVNLNSKDWAGGKLKPVLERLTDDLGATLFRQDIYGNSDWKNFDEPEFKDGAATATWLNAKGIRPYLTLSGALPKALCAADGWTLKDLEGFADRAANFAAWARRAGIRFELLGPMNETDIGRPEGPRTEPATYVKACEALVRRLDRLGLKDLKLVVAEQAHADTRFVKAFLARPRLMPRIAAFGMHTYGDGRMDAVVKLVAKSRWPRTKVWMTEYGDLEQSGEREWRTAWAITRRLFRFLDDGYQAALNWDACDNYHDHDHSWSIYGLIRRGIRVDTPKKRFWAARQVYRFVPAGWTRVATDRPWGETEETPVMAFVAPDRRHVTVVAMNQSGRNLALNVSLDGLDFAKLPARAAVWRTSESENGVRVELAPLRNDAWPHTGLDLELSADSIVTATTLPVV